MCFFVVFVLISEHIHLDNLIWTFLQTEVLSCIRVSGHDVAVLNHFWKTKKNKKKSFHQVVEVFIFPSLMRRVFVSHSSAVINLSFGTEEGFSFLSIIFRLFPFVEMMSPGALGELDLGHWATVWSLLTKLGQTVCLWLFWGGGFLNFIGPGLEIENLLGFASQDNFNPSFQSQLQGQDLRKRCPDLFPWKKDFVHDFIFIF